MNDQKLIALVSSLTSGEFLRVPTLAEVMAELTAIDLSDHFIQTEVFQETLKEVQAFSSAFNRTHGMVKMFAIAFDHVFENLGLDLCWMAYNGDCLLVGRRNKPKEEAPIALRCVTTKSDIVSEEYFEESGQSMIQAIGYRTRHPRATSIYSGTIRPVTME